MNANILKAKQLGSNAETPAPKKVIVFDNPYRELGTENSMMTDPKQGTSENRQSRHQREHPMYDRKMSFFGDSQESLLGQIADTNAMKTSGGPLTQHRSRQQ